MRLAGGDAAARDPRRSGLALLAEVRGEGFAESAEARRLFPEDAERRMLGRMIGMGVNSPWTSSVGRLFDGVAALLGLCMKNEHEAQAAMALEMAAVEAGSTEGIVGEDEELFEVRWDDRGGIWELDLRRLVGWLVERSAIGKGHGDRGRCAGGQGTREVLARVFHEQLAEGLVGLVVAAGGGRSLARVPVGVSGGVFCNGLMMGLVGAAGGRKGLSTFFHKLYPPTDAGLAFGQAVFSRQWLLTGCG